MPSRKKRGVSVEELTYFVTEEKQGFLGIRASVTAEVYASCDVKEFLFNYIGEFFTGLNQDVEIEIFEEESGYRIMLNAENNAVIIGKNGQTARRSIPSCAAQSIQRSASVSQL